MKPEDKPKPSRLAAERPGAGTGGWAASPLTLLLIQLLPLIVFIVVDAFVSDVRI